MLIKKEQNKSISYFSSFAIDSWIKKRCLFRVRKTNQRFPIKKSIQYMSQELKKVCKKVLFEGLNTVIFFSKTTGPRPLPFTCFSRFFRTFHGFATSVIYTFRQKSMKFDTIHSYFFWIPWKFAFIQFIPSKNFAKKSLSLLRLSVLVQASATRKWNILDINGLGDVWTRGNWGEE